MSNIKKNNESTSSSLMVFERKKIIEFSCFLNDSEKYLMFLLVSELNENDPLSRFQTFSMSALKNITDLHHTNPKTSLESFTGEMLEKVVCIRNVTDDTILQTRWIECFKYDYAQDIIHIVIPEKLIPYLLELRHSEHEM